MHDDFSKIKQWSNLFLHPEQLTKTVLKNWSKSREDIEKDIADMKSDWSAGNYFAAGEDTAGFMKDLLEAAQIPLIGIPVKSY